MVPMVRRIPASIPGKKPASTAPRGNLSQLLLQVAGTVELPWLPPTAVALAEGDDEIVDEELVEEGFADEVDEADGDADDEEVEP